MGELGGQVGVKTNTFAINTESYAEPGRILDYVPRVEVMEEAIEEGRAGNQYVERPVYAFTKRIIDIFLSVCAMLFLWPIFLVTAIAIKLEDGGPVIYSQTRMGKEGKPFKMYKFRSMCTDADKKLKDLAELNERDGPVFKITNDPRVTRVGSFIRKTCIDELPQIINVVKGEMSIVGPRPPLQNEVEQYTFYQMRRLDVTPGLTCFWQVCKRTSVTFEEWVELDLKYIRERCILTDMKLIFKTVGVVFRRKGAA